MPAAVATRWKVHFDDLALDERAAWWSARPERGPARRSPAVVAERTLTGGCACGACAFECRSGPEFQTQHCYCNLCRQLSGAAAQTWVPVRLEGFTWLRQETLELVRATAQVTLTLTQTLTLTLTLTRYLSCPTWRNGFLLECLGALFALAALTIVPISVTQPI